MKKIIILLLAIQFDLVNSAMPTRPIPTQREDKSEAPTHFKVSLDNKLANRIIPGSLKITILGGPKELEFNFTDLKQLTNEIILPAMPSLGSEFTLSFLLAIGTGTTTPNKTTPIPIKPRHSYRFHDSEDAPCVAEDKLDPNTALCITVTEYKD